MSGIADALPEDVVVSKSRREMTLLWSGGEQRLSLSAATLRRACRCAWCTRDRILDRFDVVDDEQAVADVEVLGSHGLHVTFADGHARGIFPWPYLRDLAVGNVPPNPGRPPDSAPRDLATSL